MAGGWVKISCMDGGQDVNKQVINDVMGNSQRYIQLSFMGVFKKK